MTGVAGGAQTVAEAVLAWLAVFAALVAVQLVVAALPADQEYVIPARTVTEAVYVRPLVTLPLTAFGTEMVGGAVAGTTLMVTEAAAVLSPAWLVAAQLTERGPAAPGAVGE